MRRIMLFLGLRREQNHSLLGVNEDFATERNDKRALLYAFSKKKFPESYRTPGEHFFRYN